MTLSELVTHTSIWLGVPRTVVESHARYLREDGLLTSGARGLAAPSMTANDKISLFVTVLGCGNARASAKALPKLLSLVRSSIVRSSSEKLLEDIDDPSLFEQPNLQKALLAMFEDMADGRFDRWRQLVETVLVKVNVARPLSLDLTVTFEIDAEYVVIRLRASGKWGKKMNVAVGPEIEFGTAPASTVAGYSRRTHEISYERLVGWGSCMAA